MATTRTALSRGALALYAVAAVTAAAAASSSFFLWARGASAGLAIAASLPPSLLLGIIALASRFLSNALPLRSASRSSIAIGHAGSAAAASGLWVLMWKSWVPALNQQFAAHLAPDYSLLFGLGVVLYIAAVAVHYLVLEIEALREAEDEVLRYRVLAREAELRAFKAQVDPHFLFNSLNAVASMCGSRPLEAREMAHRLADFFRLILRLGALERITLAEEIDLVQRYLAIEQVRFGERLTTHINVDEGAARCMVPPLLLQPLVENAVRHGVASMVEGGTIDITATLEDHMLRIVIDNPADPDRADARGEGIGIENARGRLSAVSEGRAMLQAAEAEGQFRVVIELPR
ncbi:MAG: histidine kinase [Acidobacteria bacterium]|nr:histidine kinase [Acidobacteriota bacterium]MBV9187961.1 histidine kinase [Acidobacteriota bacterium]